MGPVVTHATNNLRKLLAAVTELSHNTHTHTQQYCAVPHLRSYAFCTNRCVNPRLAGSKQTHTDTRGEIKTTDWPRAEIKHWARAWKYSPKMVLKPHFDLQALVTLQCFSSVQQNHQLPSGGSHRVKNQTSLKELFYIWSDFNLKFITFSSDFCVLIQKMIFLKSHGDFYVTVFKWHILAGRKLHMKAWRVQNAVCCWLYIFNDPPRIIYESFSSPAVLGRLTLTACDVINHPSKMLCVPL